MFGWLRISLCGCLFLLTNSIVIAQTCTIVGSGTISWNGINSVTCVGGVNPTTATILVIPAGLTVVFDGNSDTWSGSQLIVEGTLRVNAPSDSRIDANLIVKNGGRIEIVTKLTLGPLNGAPPSCNYYLQIETGGTVTIDGNPDDRLIICSVKVALGAPGNGSGNACNPYPGGPIPYCAPSPEGFTGPVTFDKGGITPTPVELIYFNIARSGDHTVVATWATATEKNSELFSIERSFNGKDFYELGVIPAAGTTNLRHDYSFTDHFPLIGRGYYRLKQVDFDGTTEYFPMKFIDLTGEKRVMVYPTLLENNELKVRLNFTTEETAFARILSVAGKEVGSFNFTGSEFRAPVGLAAGAYLLKVNIGNEQFLERFIVR